MARVRSQMGATGTCMHIDMVEYDDAWQRVGGNSFKLDKSFFNPHDFGMTPNHYVFFQARALLRFAFPAGRACRLVSAGSLTHEGADGSFYEAALVVSCRLRAFVKDRWAHRDIKAAHKKCC